MVLRTLAVAAAAMFAATNATAAISLFTEDFEGVTLRPSPQERPVPPVPVWTDVPPAGWDVDNSGVPGQGDDTQGVEDWEGWAFVDAAFWVAADDQDRSQFRDGFADGVVAVADPDEWDDVGSPADELGFYNAFMTTPVIDTTAAAGGPIFVDFASSWRDEAFDDGDLHSPNGNNQTAILTAIIDGERSEILRWESDPASPFFKDDAPNEEISILVPSAGAELQLEFGLVNAGNDWWWAVDNVNVATPEPTSALLVAVGALGLAARRR